MGGFISVFSITILITTVASVVLGVLSYTAYKLRERRRPNRNFSGSEKNQAVFFHRYARKEG